MEIRHLALQKITCQDIEQASFLGVTVHGLVLDSALLALWQFRDCRLDYIFV